MNSLYDRIKLILDSGDIEIPELSSNVENNLNQSLALRPYQIETFSYFDYYFKSKKIRQRPAQLLLHMATGSGKTLIMAGLILRLYELGYRNFVFFVNSSTIINKTRDNFLNSSSSKYLFNEAIYFGDKEVNIREVSNFEGSNDEDINIVFTTIQGLHSTLNNSSENSITYSDFEDKQIVLISDEAHHINSQTKKGKDLSKDEQEEILGWEGTVNKIFRSNSENVLLEFTATVDFEDENIKNKYFDKLLFDYPLKQFRKDGYSKEVKVLQTEAPEIERALQAMVLSQYRRKIFEKNKLIIKPVVLFKSKTIAESKAFYDVFAQTIKHLDSEILRKIKDRATEQTVKTAFNYLEENNIELENFIQELKNDFSEDKCIIVNNKDDTEKKQIILNTLEDTKNEYRAVFAVDMLNEGWDVLNLFDIVRLYNTRDSKNNKVGKTTMSEAQLIGRGARYCPFQSTDGQEKYKRKFDEDIESELRICEELYYHSAHNPKYIQELNTALQEIGLKAKTTVTINLKLKEDFKNTELFQRGYIFINKPIKNSRKDVTSLSSTLIQTKHKVSLATGFSRSVTIFTDNNLVTNFEKTQKDYHLVDFGERVLQKALNRLEFYKFNNLKSLLPNLNSISEFITSDDYLKKVRVEVEGLKEQVENLTQQDKLQIAVEVLEKISFIIDSEKVEFKGSKEFYPQNINKTFKDKVLNIAVNEDGDKEFGIAQSQTSNANLNLDLSDKEWFVFNDNFGTNQEKGLVRLINKSYNALKAKYDKVYLLRNEKHFQLFNFDDGRPLEPDFVLFLVQKEQPKNIHYQVFIEPKGSHLFENDSWKENFLLRLKDEGKIEVIFENREYRISGMPFYNYDVPEKLNTFEKSLEELV